MPQFKYVAKNSSGKTVRGIVEADDEKNAISILRREQLVIVSVKEGKPRAAFSLPSIKLGVKKISVEDVVVFSRQLATVVEAGVPLVSALDIIGEQMEKPVIRARVFKIRDDIEAGMSFSEAISRHKELFSAFFVNMVRAGEASGTLDEILDRLAVYLEKSNNLQKKVQSALIYPCVVILMAVAITLVLILKVIPVFKDIYAGFGAGLPMPTQVLIGLSDFLQAYFFIIAIFFVIVYFVLARSVKTKKGRHMMDTFKLKMPVFGKLITKVAISKFTRTFATLVKSGVPVIDTLEIVGKTSGNIVVEEAIEKVKVSVAEGEGIASPLSHTGVFPPMVVRMISVGEKTGELEKMLTKIADFYETQVDAAVSGMTSLIEPLVIAFLGIVIGGIVVCMFLPILQISDVVNM